MNTQGDSLEIKKTINLRKFIRQQKKALILPIFFLSLPIFLIVSTFLYLVCRLSLFGFIFNAFYKLIMYLGLPFNLILVRLLPGLDYAFMGEGPVLSVFIIITFEMICYALLSYVLFRLFFLISKKSTS